MLLSAVRLTCPTLGKAHTGRPDARRQSVQRHWVEQGGGSILEVKHGFLRSPGERIIV